MSLKTRLALAALALSLGTLIACGPVPDTPLLRAAATGNTDQVRTLLEGGADPNEMGKSGLPAIVWAARAGDLKTLDVLLVAGAQPDLRDHWVNGWTPLIHAIHKGQSEAARRLLDAGADPNARMDGGATPIIFAASYGNTSLVRLLLERGADPRAEARGGVTALWGALGGGALFDLSDGPSLGTCFPETARVLLDQAPDLKLRKGFPRAVLEALGRPKECSELIARLEAP